MRREISEAWHREGQPRPWHRTNVGPFSGGNSPHRPTMVEQVIGLSRRRGRDAERRESCGQFLSCPAGFPLLNSESVLNMKHESVMSHEEGERSTCPGSGYLTVPVRIKEEGDITPISIKEEGDITPISIKEGYITPANIKKERDITPVSIKEEANITPVSIKEKADSTPVSIKEEGDTYSVDNQDSEKRKHISVTGNPIITSVFSLSLKREEDTCLKKESEPEKRSTGRPDEGDSQPAAATATQPSAPATHAEPSGTPSPATARETAPCRHATATERQQREHCRWRRLAVVESSSDRGSDAMVARALSSWPEQQSGSRPPAPSAVPPPTTTGPPAPALPAAASTASPVLPPAWPGVPTRSVTTTGRSRHGSAHPYRQDRGRASPSKRVEDAGDIGQYPRAIEEDRQRQAQTQGALLGVVRSMSTDMGGMRLALDRLAAAGDQQAEAMRQLAAVAQQQAATHELLARAVQHQVSATHLLWRGAMASRHHLRLLVLGQQRQKHVQDRLAHLQQTQLERLATTLLANQEADIRQMSRLSDLLELQQQVSTGRTTPPPLGVEGGPESSGRGRRTSSRLKAAIRAARPGGSQETP